MSHMLIRNLFYFIILFFKIYNMLNQCRVT